MPLKRRCGCIKLFLRQLPWWRYVVLVVCCIAWNSEPRRVWSADLPDHPQDVLAKSLTSIDSLSCDYVQVITKDKDRQPGRRIKYAREGSRWHVTELPLDVGPAGWEESVTCFDGNHVYSYLLKHSVDGQVSMGTIQIHDAGQPPIVSPECFMGMTLTNRLKPLPVLLRSHPIELATRQGVEGTQETHLVLKAISGDVIVNKHRFASDVDVMLDLEHGMLPSVLRVEFAAETKAFTETHRHWFQQWRVLKFDKVLDEASQEKRWFPCLGVLEQGGVPKESDRGPLIELSLENVRINPVLDQALFKPRVQGGTTVFDLTTK